MTSNWTPEQVKHLAAFHMESANYQRIGQTVLILKADKYQNLPGKVYNYLPGLEHPWQVTPLAWFDDVPAFVAYNDHEIAFDSISTVRARCEACGVLFEPEQGYYVADDPTNHVIGYAYCADCCHW